MLCSRSALLERVDLKRRGKEIVDLGLGSIFHHSPLPAELPRLGRGGRIAEHVEDLDDADKAEAEEESKEAPDISNEADDSDLLPSHVQLDVRIPEVNVKDNQILTGISSDLKNGQ